MNFPPIVRAVTSRIWSHLGAGGMVILIASGWLTPVIGAQLPDYRPSEPISGILSSAGSDAMDTLMKRWAELLSQAHPNVVVSIRKGTSVSGLAALAEGTADLSASGRSAWEAEIRDFQRKTGRSPAIVTVRFALATRVG